MCFSMQSRQNMPDGRGQRGFVHTFLKTSQHPVSSPLMRVLGCLLGKKVNIFKCHHSATPIGATSMSSPLLLHSQAQSRFTQPGAHIFPLVVFNDQSRGWAGGRGLGKAPQVPANYGRLFGSPKVVELSSSKQLDKLLKTLASVPFIQTLSLLYSTPEGIKSKSLQILQVVQPVTADCLLVVPGVAQNVQGQLVASFQLPNDMLYQ